MSAQQFIQKLQAFRSEEELHKSQRFFKSGASDNQILGVRMKQLFDLAKEHIDMPLVEIEKLLESPYYEARMGAVSIMDFQARRKKTSEEQRKKLFQIYISRHDRINNWDLVDRSAKHVVGGYLHEFEKPRNILYELARSENIWKRRTAIVSTSYFIPKGELDDTYKIAEILIDDEEELINKAVGGWIREAGKKDEKRLKAFLDTYAATMPRVTLRYAIEKFDQKSREHYLNLGHKT